MPFIRPIRSSTSFHGSQGVISVPLSIEPKSPRPIPSYYHQKQTKVTDGPIGLDARVGLLVDPAISPQRGRRHQDPPREGGRAVLLLDGRPPSVRNIRILEIFSIRKGRQERGLTSSTTALLSRWSLSSLIASPIHLTTPDRHAPMWQTST